MEAATRLSFEPIEALLSHPSANEIGDLLGTTKRNVCRWRADGLSLNQADRIAVALGVHPGELWPEWWDADAMVA